MKSFIDKIFRKKKYDAEQIEENKTILSEQIETSIKERIDQNRINMDEVEAINKKVKTPNPWLRPQHLPVCECHKCIRWKEAENAE